MVDRDARKELATCLHRLVSGEMTNDEFDARYYEGWRDSEDGAVAEVAAFGWGLYSSDLPLPYRLHGRYAVSGENREMADRATLFLQTEQEYGWPGIAGYPPRYGGLWGPGCYLLIGLIFLYVAQAARDPSGLVMGALGLLAVSPTIHWLLARRRRAAEWEHFCASGDLRAWPFLRQADLEVAQARRHP